MNIEKALLAGMSALLMAGAAPCQTTSFGPLQPLENISSTAPPGFQLNALRMESCGASGAIHDQGQPHGFVRRMFRRGLDDQKELYSAPFKPSNIKWDVLVLGGTAALLATDKRIEEHLPDGHFQVYQNSSNIALGGLAASLAALGTYGLKTDHPRAKETGELELETLTNTFLVYAPMQFIAGRQRPGEGNGNGDFWRHHALNTSFPGGHAMFTWGMATVLAREYPSPWVRTLAYGTALTVTASRFLARDHWSSDMFVGSVLGLAIGTHIFHSHCDPGLSPSCHRHTKKWEQP